MTGARNFRNSKGLPGALREVEEEKEEAVVAAAMLQGMCGVRNP
jgi:hypothetical protein